MLLPPAETFQRLRALVVMKCFLMFNLCFPPLSITPLLVVKYPQIKTVAFKGWQAKRAHKVSRAGSEQPPKSPLDQTSDRPE